MRKLLFVITVVACLLLTSCATEKRTKGEKYAQMYVEKPTTMLIMPPINNSVDVDAKEAYYTSVACSVAEAGYYVVAPFMAMDILKNESAYDAEEFIDASLSTLGRYFGADAAVFTIIDKWVQNGGVIQVDVTCIVKSTATNRILYERKCGIFLNRNNVGGPTVEDVVKLFVTGDDSAFAQKQIIAARILNQYLFNDMPLGKYSPRYMQDMDDKAKESVINISK